MDDFIEKETKFWLENLYNENTNDDIGKQALRILGNNKKLKTLIDKINNDEELWSIFHKTIEYYMFN